MRSESTLTLFKGINMKNKKLWTELSDEHCEKLVGGHPPGGNEFEPFGTEPLLKSAIPALMENGAFATAIPGIFQGFVVHAPTCAGHPGFH